MEVANKTHVLFSAVIIEQNFRKIYQEKKAIDSEAG